MLIMCPAPADPLRPFTEAQERIAELLADGHSAPVIAGVLHCSYHTVKTHIQTMALILPGDGDPQERIRVFARERRGRRAS